MKLIPPYLKKTDAWSTVLFADPVGIGLAKLLSHTPVHPNAVTLVSLLPAFASVYFFWLGDPISLIWAALLFQASWILDCTDGKLAKMTNKQTEFGVKLDPKIDFIRKFLAFGGLVWGVYRQWGIIWFIVSLSGVVFHYGIHFLAHRVPPSIHGGAGTAVEKRLIRRVGYLYTAYDEQFLILFLAPLFAWLVHKLPVYMVWVASLFYAINALVMKIRLKRKKQSELSS